MQIVVAEIPRGGRQLQVDPGVDWALRAATEALEVEPMRLSGLLDVAYPARRERVDVRCRIEAAAERPCDRCGERVSIQLRCDELLLYFSTQAQEDVDGEVELDAEDLEVGWYEDGALDAESVVREALALALPARVACEDSAACDQRTEQLLASANENAPVGHPAFAVLRDLQ